jgi:hypothetical protein
MRQRRQAMRVQIHRHEGGLVDHVEPAEGVVELDAVEDERMCSFARDVAEVKIAMALAHPAGGQPGSDDRRDALERGGLPGREPFERGLLCAAVGRPARPRSLCAQVAQAVQQRGAHQRRRAEAAIGRRHRASGVEARDARSQIVDVGGAQLAAARQPVPQVRVVERAHLHRDIEHRAASVELRPRQAARDLDDVEVKVRGEAPVQAQLFGARASTQGQRRLVEERGGDRLLQLVGMAAEQQHMRDVGLEVPRRGGTGRRPLRGTASHQPQLLGRRQLGLARGSGSQDIDLLMHRDVQSRPRCRQEP